MKTATGQVFTCQWQTIGHDAPKRFLEHALQTGRLAHAYLFVGPTSVGKTFFARDFGRILQCAGAKRPCGVCAGCKNADLTSDLVVLDSPEPIAVDDIRRLRSRFSLKSFAVPYKVAVIANAERLSGEAANALLKFLEEPTGDTVIILTSTTTAALPATISSRTQKVFFRLEKLHVETAIERLHAPPAAATAVRALSYGRTGRAISLIIDDAARERAREESSQLEEIISGDPIERYQSVEALAELETPEFLRILQIWCMDLAARMRDAQEDMAACARRADALLAARSETERSLNRKLILDNLLINFQKNRI